MKALSDRLIILRENQRNIVRGLSYDAVRRVFLLDMREDEALNVIVDVTGILDTNETVAPSITKAEGITATATSAGGKITLALSGLSSVGDVTLKLTRSGGQIHIIKLRARTERAMNRLGDYNTAWGYG